MYNQINMDYRPAEEFCSLFDIVEEDLKRIQGLQSIVAEKMDEMLDEWYSWLKNHLEYEEFFSDPKTLTRVRKEQHKFWDAFFHGKIDEDYLHLRRMLGETHARIGLPHDFFFAGIDRWLTLFVSMLNNMEMPIEEYNLTRRSINKMIHLDMTVIIQSYQQLTNEAIASQSKALMEMSTPVTQIWNGILLLPVVGIIDSKRAQDIINATLRKISETHARSFILDISGVAVVDTAVANHLIKITKATRLMGCESTISGVSPAIAQTIVDLGIDVGKIKTTANMKAALSSAFEKMGLVLRKLNP